MKRLLVAAGMAFAIALSTPAMAGPQEDFEALREEVWQWNLDTSPGLATEIGDRRGDGLLNDNSLAAYEQRVADTRAFRARLQAIDAAALPDSLQIDYALLLRDFDDRIEAAAFDQERYIVFTNRNGPQGAIAGLPYGSPLFTLADYESYLGRLEAFPAYVDNAIARTDMALERGLTQACEPMEGFAERVTGLMAATPEDSIWWGAFAERPATISAEQWTALENRARRAIADGAFVGLDRFATYYTTSYAPNCRQGLPGIGNTPGGQDYYAYLVRSFTTTQMTPAQVHQLGLDEVARIRAEMETVATAAGFDSREAFIEHLRTDPQYYAQTPEELMTAAAALAKQIDGWMPRLFGNLPRLPYTVLPIPDASAPGNTTAYYESGSLATGQPGIYRVNTTELDQRPLWELPALGVHEAVPGHHHQISLQQELDMHPLRSYGTFFTVFIEGWGLYSERLGIEMGLYDTPARDMGRLSYEMWRATRLVVDTGIHAMGWTREQAVDYMLDNTALSQGNVNAEVNRYITNPGQALAYKLGELKFRELRARAEAALGPEFDLRAFHDALLENGAIPLDVLEAHIDRWIAGQQAGE